MGAGLPLEPWNTPTPFVSPIQSPAAVESPKSFLSVTDMDAHFAAREVNAAAKNTSANESMADVIQIAGKFAVTLYGCRGGQLNNIDCRKPRGRLLVSCDNHGGE